MALLILDIRVKDAESNPRHSLHLPLKRGVELFKDDPI
jgi:hypothetical protein